MATTLNVGDILKVRVCCQQQTQISTNVGHFRISAIAGSSVTDVQAAASIAARMAPVYKAIINNTASYLGTGVQRISPSPELLEQINKTGAGAGLVAGFPLPPQVAGLGKKHTALAKPAHRGFLYIPFPSVSDQGGVGAPLPAWDTKAAALMAEWTGAIELGTAPNTAIAFPVIYHAETNFTTDMTGFSVRKVWSQQKRRSFIRRADQVPF